MKRSRIETVRRCVRYGVVGLIVGLTVRPLWAGSPAPDFAETDAVSGLSIPTAVAFLPDGRMLVTQLSGELLLVAGGSADLLTTIDVCLLPAYFEGETGLLGIAVHPDFPADRSIYLYRTKRGTSEEFCGLFSFGPDQPVNEVVRVRLEEDGTVDTASLEVVLTGLRVLHGFHNGGVLRIGPDRKLYVGVGDTYEGDQEGPPGTSNNAYAQDLGSLEGKILRLELDGSVPSDNPFAGQGGAQGEIFALGFRNPWRMGFDPVTGRLWVGDVGEDTVEEIDIVVAGGNYAWPRCEGTLPADCRQPGDVDPVFAYPHSGAESLGVSVVGGAFPRGGNFAALEEQYFFADFGDEPTYGAVYRAPLNAARDGLAGPAQAVVTNAGGPVDLVFGPDGTLYYVSFLDGAVRRVATSIASSPDGGPAEGCASIAACDAIVDAALPDPGAVDKKSKKFARKIVKLERKADKALRKAQQATGNKQEKQYRKARAALEQLLNKARQADAKGRLGVPLATLETAVEGLLALIPNP
jgi:glucose/arabinose dehydrogenase